MKQFIDFVRSQGVIGLATGFLLGSAVTKVVSSLVSDIIDPFLGLLLGAAGNLKEATVAIGPATVKWGNFVSTFIDFLVIATIVFILMKFLRLEKIDKKKQP